MWVCPRRCPSAPPRCGRAQIVGWLLMKRFMVFGLLAAALWTAENWWLNARQVDVSIALALDQLNGGDSAARELRSFEILKDSIHVVASLGTLLAAVFLLGPLVRQHCTRVATWFKRAGPSANRTALAVALLPAGL